MDECGSTSCAHPWKAASTKRKAWALSRDSWQASGSRDAGGEGQPSQERTREKAPLAEEPGRIPNKITSWLKECRTPLGASLDEQSNTATKGTVKIACSFEDDLSLGAEANHLRAGGTPLEAQRFGMLAQQKRTQFQQKGQSMNSTGSGKSNTTVSSISELLDLYEEDPEEILYNLGFGTEEADIATKIPSRFFNASSNARGIDIKVYLGAQLQRLELENPNYALTSRFRQIEVLTTVANAFSSLYSQVSGTPVPRIGRCDTEPREAPPLKRNNSALNVAKILKKTATKRSLQGNADGGDPPTGPGTEREKEPDGRAHEQTAKAKKDQLSLATVTETEESRQGPAETDGPPAADDPPPTPEDPDCAPMKDARLCVEANAERNQQRAATSTHRPHPCITHLLSQAKDSFEMEEVQSNEGDGAPALRSTWRDGNELLLRTASQHSDSSGFAEDPSTDGPANHLKVQESSDSCDSETTVTSNAGELRSPFALEHPIFQKLQGGEESITATVPDGTLSLDPPAFPKLQGGEESITAMVPDGTLSLDPPAFPKLQGREESITAMVPDGTLSLDPPAFPKLQGREEAQTGAVPDGADVLNDATLSGRQSHNKEEDEFPESPLHQIPQSAEREAHERQPETPSSADRPGSPADPGVSTRVVSSVSIQLRPGGTRHCTPTSFSYRYTPKDEEEDGAVSGATLIVNTLPKKRDPPDMLRGAEDAPLGRIPPYRLHLPPHLTHSSCSLHSAPPDWPDRPLCEWSRSWSTSSMPTLHPHSAPHSSLPPHSAPYSSPHPQPHIGPYSSHHPQPHCGPHSSPYPQPHCGPYSSPYPQPHCSPYSSPQPQPHCSPYSSPQPQPHCGPYSSSNYCPSYLHAISPLAAPGQPPSGIEMQLRRVLHDVRGAVNLAQSSSLCGEDMGTPLFSPQRAAQPLYEDSVQELQGIRRNLSVFRTQMMDLEVALMRQQDRAYQHLTQSDRQEAENIQSLRTVVRQELQELELQLEDRLLFLDEQLRTSHYRHPVGIHRDQSMDSLCSTSPTNVAESVTHLLREQLYLQTELGYEGGASDSVAPSLSSSCSSEPASPMRPLRAQSHDCPSPQRMGVYQASIRLTPDLPPRQQAPPPPQRPETPPAWAPPEDGGAGRGTRSSPLQLDEREEGGADRPHLQQLIKEIKRSIADEIRQEIVSDLLAAVLPRRSPR